MIVMVLVAGAFRSCFCLFHSSPHFRFDSVKVETRAALHGRILEEGLELFAYHLLDEYEAPELELEPIEVLLPSFFRPIVGPACALERIETQVGDVGHVGMGLFTQPTLGLVNESEFVIVN